MTRRRHRPGTLVPSKPAPPPTPHLSIVLLIRRARPANEPTKPACTREQSSLPHKYWSLPYLHHWDCPRIPHFWQQQHSINDHPNTSPHLIQRYARAHAHAHARDPLARANAMARFNAQAALEHLSEAAVEPELGLHLFPVFLD